MSAMYALAIMTRDFQRTVADFIYKSLFIKYVYFSDINKLKVFFFNPNFKLLYFTAYLHFWISLQKQRIPHTKASCSDVGISTLVKLGPYIIFKWFVWINYTSLTSVFDTCNNIFMKHWFSLPGNLSFGIYDHTKHLKWCKMVRTRNLRMNITSCLFRTRSR